MFALEALTSTDVVLEAITASLEKMSMKRKNADGEDGTPAMLAYSTGFLLLRTKKAAAFTKRLEAVYAAAVKAKFAEGEHTIRGGLDLALHGNAGAANGSRTSWPTSECSRTIASSSSWST